MARRKTTRTRTVYRKARTSYRRSGGISGLLQPLLGGVISGAVDKTIGKPFGINGLPLAGAGFVLKNKTMKDLGMIQIGYSLTNMFMQGQQPANGDSGQGGFL